MVAIDPFAPPPTHHDPLLAELMRRLIETVAALQAGFEPAEQTAPVLPELVVPAPVVIDRTVTTPAPTIDLEPMLTVLLSLLESHQDHSWVDELARKLDHGNVVVGGGGGGRIKNIAREYINPATEDTLLQILAELEEGLTGGGLPAGTYTYESGIGTGEIVTTGPMLSVNVIAGVFADSTFQIGSGPVVTVPRRSNLTLNQEAKIGSTTVTFTAVASIVVDWLGPSNGLLFDGSSLLFDGSLLTFTPGG